MASNDKQSRPQRRPGRPATAIRQIHFVKVEGRWRCKHCTVSYAENTASGNLTSHITKNHSDIAPIEGYSDASSTSPGYVNMGYSPGQPNVIEPSPGPSRNLYSTNPVAKFSPESSYVHQHVQSPVRESSIGLSPSVRALPSSPSAGNFSPESSYVHPPEHSQFQFVDSTRQSNMSTTNNQYDYYINLQGPNTYGPTSQSVLPNQMDMELTAVYASEHMNYALTSLGQTQSTPFQTTNNLISQDNSRYIYPNEISLYNQLNEANNVTATQLSLIDNLSSIVEEAVAAPNLETVTDHRSAMKMKRKRDHVLVIKKFVSLRDLEDYVEELENDGFGRRAIQNYVENAILGNKILFNAFMRRPLDALKMIDSRFGKITIGLLGDGLIGERKDTMRTILREKCEQRWEPCLFQVYIFSFQMRNANYCTVELGFQNQNSQRRSCILDCIQLPPDAPNDFIIGTVLHLLADFGVENKLSDVSIRGNVINSDLAATLKEKIKVKDQRLKIKLKATNQKNQKRIREYFQVPGIDYLDKFYSLQMHLANYDSLSNEIKGLYERTIAEALKKLSKNPTESDDVRQFLNAAATKCHRLRTRMSKLTEVANSIQPILFKISQDVENHVYYLPINSRERVNLLRLVPLESYQRTLGEVNRLLGELLELLQRYLHPNDELSASIDDMIMQMENIVIESVEIPDLSDPFPIQFENWDKICKQGLRICDQYVDICNYLVDLYTYYNDRSISPYVNELIQMSSYTPLDFPFDKFKRIAFLKAWKTFESIVSDVRYGDT